jgi:hypothetical protein
LKLALPRSDHPDQPTLPGMEDLVPKEGETNPAAAS